MTGSSTGTPSRVLGRWGHPALLISVVSVLLCLGIANVTTLATWREVEDGVLWELRPEGVVAGDVAPGTSAAALGLKRGDLLLAIDDRPVQDVADVSRALHRADVGSTLR